MPMSRPSITTLPSAASSRCRSRITSRTSGWRATTGTIRSTLTCRIAEVTSVPADEHAAGLVERDRVLPREVAEQRPLTERRAARERKPGEAAVHRAGVEVAEPEALGEPAGHRALAGAGRPVDRDDQSPVLLIREEASGTTASDGSRSFLRRSLGLQGEARPAPRKSPGS